LKTRTGGIYTPVALRPDHLKQKNMSVTSHRLCKQVTEVAPPQWSQLPR